MYQAATQRLANWLSLWYIFHIGKLHHNFLLICKIVSFSNSSYIANYQKISSQFGTIGKNHIQSSSSFSQNCSFCLLWIWYFPNELYHESHYRTSVLFLFAIHLPPVEDEEFLLKWKTEFRFWTKCKSKFHIGRSYFCTHICHIVFDNHYSV